MSLATQSRSVETIVSAEKLLIGGYSRLFDRSSHRIPPLIYNLVVQYRLGSSQNGIPQCDDVLKENLALRLEFSEITYIIQEKYVFIAKPPQKTGCPSDIPYKSGFRELLAIEMYFSWMICADVQTTEKNKFFQMNSIKMNNPLIAVFEHCQRKEPP